MALIEVKVPDIGDFKDVSVIELLVKAGDAVKVEQSLITVESDKASMEIPSASAGVVKEMKLKVGDTVNEGSVILMLEAADAAAAPPPPSPAPAGEAAKPGAPSSAARAGAGRGAPPPPPSSIATCSCSAPARAAIRLHSAPPISG